jgi:hypothetical protein
MGFCTPSLALPPAAEAQRLVTRSPAGSTAFLGGNASSLSGWSVGIDIA